MLAGFLVTELCAVAAGAYILVDVVGLNVPNAITIARFPLIFINVAVSLWNMTRIK